MSESFNIDSITNDGERLIPFISHNDQETIRHVSSHFFFRNIINNDINELHLSNLKILDLGFGTGYASFLYSKINSVNRVHSIDVSDELLDWAKDNYYDPKIEYQICDAVEYLKKTKEKYSYIVTRHVLEHIDKGLGIVDENNFSKRLMINVPYNEKKGNPFHILTGITKKDFPDYKNVEFFYEDLEGNTYNKIPRNIKINSIICIASKDGLPKVESYFKFPVKGANILDIYKQLRINNYNFVDNILEMQIKRGLTYTNTVDEIAALKDQFENLKKSSDDERNKILNELTLSQNKCINIQSELNDIYNSKKWKYINKVSRIISKLKAII